MNVYNILTVVTSRNEANCNSLTFSEKKGETPMEDACKTEVSVKT